METTPPLGLQLQPRPPFNFLASLINGNLLVARRFRLILSFNFLASLINGNSRRQDWDRFLTDPFNFLASLINGNPEAPRANSVYQGF